MEKNSTANKGKGIKNPGHLIYRKGFWMAYTAFSYASMIFGAFSTLISAIDLFDGMAAGDTASSPFHLLTSAIFLAAGFMFLSARTFWGRLLLYTRKQDRQNELVINAKDVDDYRQKEAERERQQLQQMDRTIEAAVERKMNDMDSRIESYTRMNAKMQKNFQAQYMSYLEDQLKKLDERFANIGRLTANKAQEAKHDEELHDHLKVFVDEEAMQDNDEVSFEEAVDNLGYSDVDDSDTSQIPEHETDDYYPSDSEYSEESYDESMYKEEVPPEYLNGN